MRTIAVKCCLVRNQSDNVDTWAASRKTIILHRKAFGVYKRFGGGS